MRNINDNQFKPAEFLQAHFSAHPDEGTTLGMLMEPKWWAGVARHITVGARIDVLPLDRSFFAQLIVHRKTHNEVFVTVISSVDLPTEEAVPVEPGVFNGHRIKHLGASKKWSVARIGKAGQPDIRLRDGFGSEDEARQYVLGQLTARGQAAA